MSWAFRLRGWILRSRCAAARSKRTYSIRATRSWAASFLGACGRPRRPARRMETRRSLRTPSRSILRLDADPEALAFLGAARGQLSQARVVDLRHRIGHRLPAASKFLMARE